MLSLNSFKLKREEKLLKKSLNNKNNLVPQRKLDKPFKFEESLRNYDNFPITKFSKSKPLSAEKKGCPRESNHFEVSKSLQNRFSMGELGNLKRKIMFDANQIKKDKKLKLECGKKITPIFEPTTQNNNKKLEIKSLITIEHLNSNENEEIKHDFDELNQKLKLMTPDEEKIKNNNDTLFSNLNESEIQNESDNKKKHKKERKKNHDISMEYNEEEGGSFFRYTIQKASKTQKKIFGAEELIIPTRSSKRLIARKKEGEISVEKLNDISLDHIGQDIKYIPNEVELEYPPIDEQAKKLRSYLRKDNLV